MADLFNMEKIKLTIGIPAYNEEKFLARTLDSILAQTYINYTVYICDDCSTDSTLEIAKQYSHKDNRIKVITNPEKTTFVENWKSSLRICETEYFAWIGAHDILDPNYFITALEIHENSPKSFLVYPLSIGIDSDDNLGLGMDSNLDTRGMSISQGLLQNTKNLGLCTAIHGIFRTTMLKCIPFKHIIGFDTLMLILAPIYGEIIPTEKVLFYRREVRIETEEQRLMRWKNSGMFSSFQYSKYTVIAKYFFIHYLLSNDRNFFHRLNVSRRLLIIFSNQFSVSKMELLKCFFRF